MPRNGSGGFNLLTNSWNPAINGVSASASDWQALIDDVAASVQQSVSADGQTPITGNLNMGGNRLTNLSAGSATGQSLRFEQLFSQGLQQDIAAAATVDIGAALSTLVNITGAGTITSFGTNYNGPRLVRFAGVCTLTNSGSLVLPGGANITTEAGDGFIAVPLGNPATGWRLVGSVDSKFLAYKPAGTGAVATTVQTKLRQTVNVKDFGATGNNVTDDWAAIQAALTYLASILGGRLVFPPGKYKISQPLVLTPASLPAALTGSDIHFSDHVEFVLEGQGDARIIASASMSKMLSLIFNAGTSSIGPFYSRIEGLTFDGANLATTAIDSDFTMHVSILKNKIWRVVNGINFTGYGVSKIRDNVIKATYCINFSQGGGDSDISANDFYPLASGRGVNIAKLGSDATIANNVFNGEGLTGCIGVYLDGTTALSTDLIINVRVLNNEFSGMTFAVYGQRNAGGRNIFAIRVINNHTIPAAGGAVNTGNLVNFTGVDDCIIADNFINAALLPATSTSEPGIQLSDCQRPSVHGNKIANLKGPAAYLTNVTFGQFYANEVFNVGQNGVSGVIFDIDTGSTDNRFFLNDLNRTNVAFAQESFFERAGANRNEFIRNRIRGCNRTTKTGVASVVSGAIIASGSYTLSGGVAALNPNSSGFTVARTAAGVCTVTLATTQADTSYRVKATSDASQVAIDTYTTSTFIVRTFNSSGVASDALLTHIEVVF